MEHLSHRYHSFLNFYAYRGLPARSDVLVLALGLQFVTLLPAGALCSGQAIWWLFSDSSWWFVLLGFTFMLVTFEMGAGAWLVIRSNQRMAGQRNRWNHVTRGITMVWFVSALICIGVYMGVNSGDMDDAILWFFIGPLLMLTGVLVFVLAAYLSQLKLYLHWTRHLSVVANSQYMIGILIFFLGLTILGMSCIDDRFLHIMVYLLAYPLLLISITLGCIAGGLSMRMLLFWSNLTTFESDLDQYRITINEYHL